MTATKQELYNTIDLIPDSVAKELLNYADYLTSKKDIYKRNDDRWKN